MHTTQQQGSDWEVVETITVGRVMAKISKRTSGRPVYNYEIGAVTEKGVFGKRIRVYVGGQGKVAIDEEKTGNPDDLKNLALECEKYIITAMQQHEDEFIARRQDKESRGQFKPKKKEYKGHRQKGDKRGQNEAQG